MAVTQAQMTLEDFLNLPEDEPALEFEDGMVSQKVSPKVSHGRLQTYLAHFLNELTEPREIGFSISEVRATFGGHSYVPDITMIRWDQMPFKENGEFAEDIATPPAVTIEIVSPTQTVNTLIRRCVWYTDNGVEIAVLIDPADRSVVTFRPGQRPVVLTGDDVIRLDGVIDDIALTVNELFANLRPRRRAH
jgi:Uma2 family endonuclease